MAFRSFLRDSELGSAGTKWIWRCHIDLTDANPSVWEFFRPYVEMHDASVWTMKEFVPDSLSMDRVVEGHPSIDPLSVKNLEMPLPFAEELCRRFRCERVRFSNSLLTPALYDGIAGTPGGAAGDTLSYNINSINDTAKPGCPVPAVKAPGEGGTVKREWGGGWGVGGGGCPGASQRVNHAAVSDLNETELRLFVNDWIGK